MLIRKSFSNDNTSNRIEYYNKIVTTLRMSVFNKELLTYLFYLHQHFTLATKNVTEAK